MSKQVQVDYEQCISSTTQAASSVIDHAVESLLTDIVVGKCPRCTYNITLGNLIDNLCGGCLNKVKVVVDNE